MTREEAIKIIEGVFKSKEAYKHYDSVTHQALNLAIEALDTEAVQGDAISKQFVSDAILQKISELNAQGEKAIPISREFIRFKRFIDGITPIRAEAVQGVGRYENAIQKLRELPRYINGVKVRRIEKMPTKADTAEVVRCKDCRHADECHKSVQYTRNEPNTVTLGYLPIEWCSRGERREKSEVEE